ncbi:MAG: dTMP kinase, partial [Methanobacteriota archaeon]
PPTQLLSITMETGEENTMKHFITFEGFDGSGKSTIAKLVYERLQKEGYPVVLTYEPTDTPVGKYVQDCIKTSSDPFITAFTFIADRIQHCQQIQHWLDEKKIVLCDRYADSTYAYQGAQLTKEIRNPIKWLQDLSKNRILIPDRTFLFIIDPKESIKRIQSRNNLIPFERVTFLKKVHANYLKLSTEKRFLKVDATKTKEEIAELCYRDILS